MDHDARHSQAKVAIRPPRERMVRSAGQLIRRKGVAGVGMREIVLEADAPRGSLQHYFPGGKDELVSEALDWMGGVAARRVTQSLKGVSKPSELLFAIVDYWRRDLVREEFQAGCPLVAAAADALAQSERVRVALKDAFDGWLEVFESSLVELGVPPERTPSLAMLAVSGLEGAIVLSRVRRDLAPLDAFVAEIGPVLDSASQGDFGEAGLSSPSRR